MLTNDMSMRAPRMGINFSGFLDSSSGFVASCFSPDLNYEYSHHDDEDDDINYGNDNHCDDFNNDNDDDGALCWLPTRPEYRRWWAWRVKMWRWKDEDDSRVRENWGKLDSMTSVLFAGFFPFYLVVNPSNLTGCEKPLCDTDLDKNITFLLQKEGYKLVRGLIPKNISTGIFPRTCQNGLKWTRDLFEWTRKILEMADQVYVHPSRTGLQN